MVLEGFGMLAVAEMSKAIIHEMVVVFGWIRASGYCQVFNVGDTKI